MNPEAQPTATRSEWALRYAPSLNVVATDALAASAARGATRQT